MATNEITIISLKRLLTFLTNLKNTFAEKEHTHATSDITGLDTALSGKSDTTHTHTKADIGLGNVDNKSSETIRGELTKENVTTALGYTPPTTDTTYSVATGSTNGLMSASDKTKLDNIKENSSSIIRVANTTLATSGFSSQSDGTYMYTLANSSVSDGSIVDVYFASGSRSAGSKADVWVSSAAGNIYFHAKKVPSQNLVAESILITTL